MAEMEPHPDSEERIELPPVHVDADAMDLLVAGSNNWY